VTFPARLDGSALAGPLSEIFTADITAALRRCPDCALTGPLAGLDVYGPDPGYTARCPGCGNIALRTVRHSSTLWLAFGADGAFQLPLR
jgi:hypothetical protein